MSPLRRILEARGSAAGGCAATTCCLQHDYGSCVALYVLLIEVGKGPVGWCSDRPVSCQRCVVTRTSTEEFGGREASAALTVPASNQRRRLETAAPLGTVEVRRASIIGIFSPVGVSSRDEMRSRHFVFDGRCDCNKARKGRSTNSDVSASEGVAL
eukprot:scaffold994_cov226-Prasinococcus_capsulatus_cf.AAC.21